MSVALIQIGAWLFYALIGALVVGRIGLFVLRVGNFDTLAAAWARRFNHLTAYLR
jgi:hypothetical protein